MLIHASRDLQPAYWSITFGQCAIITERNHWRMNVDIPWDLYAINVPWMLKFKMHKISEQKYDVTNSLVTQSWSTLSTPNLRFEVKIIDE